MAVESTLTEPEVFLDTSLVIAATVDVHLAHQAAASYVDQAVGGGLEVSAPRQAVSDQRRICRALESAYLSWTAFMLANASKREHLSEDGQHGLKFRLRQTSKTFEQSLAVDSANLVDDDLTLFAIELTRDSEWIRLSGSSQWDNYGSLQVRIQFVR
jgi:hypothetical protein